MSYPLNFGIYCGMSKQFRDTAKQLIPIPCKSIRGGRNNGGIMIVTNTKETGSHQRMKSESNFGTQNKVPTGIEIFSFAYFFIKLCTLIYGKITIYYFVSNVERRCYL